MRWKKAMASAHLAYYVSVQPAKAAIAYEEDLVALQFLVAPPGFGGAPTEATGRLLVSAMRKIAEMISVSMIANRTLCRYKSRGKVRKLIHSLGG